MGVFIMLNNFFHDFAVGLLFASLLVLSYIYRVTCKDNSSYHIEFIRGLYATFKKVIISCWVMIIVGGVIRTFAYEQYEWMEAAGRGQVTALIIKHILLVTFVIWGITIQIRLKKQLRKSTRSKME